MSNYFEDRLISNPMQSVKAMRISNRKTKVLRIKTAFAGTLGIHSESSADFAIRCLIQLILCMIVDKQADRNYFAMCQ